jgi:CRP/FNR family transcriptional regulator
MAGETIGMDGIGTDIHECEAVALEDTEVCRMPFEQLENLARLSDEFGRTLHKLLSRESARLHALMIILGTMRAEQRLAGFLLELSQRYRARGYSSSEFVLRMTREEIGSYLGLKLETVSRLFSRFQHEGLLQVQGRSVKLLDRTALRQLIDCGGPCRGARVPALETADRLLRRSHAAKASVRGCDSWVIDGKRMSPA